MRWISPGILPFLFLVGIAGTAYSQDKLPVTLEQSFFFSPYPDDGQKITNTILQTIAEGSGKLRVFTSYNFQMDLQTDFFVEKAGKTKLFVVPESMMVTGDTYYHDFDLSHLLIPNKADFMIRVFSPDHTMIYSGIYEGIEMPLAGDVWFELDVPYDDAADNLRVEFHDASFYYDDRTLGRIRRWGQALETYYAAPRQLEAARDLIGDLDPDNVEQLLLGEFRLCEAEGILGKIHFAAFNRWLNLAGNDPEGVLRGYEALRLQTDSLREAFNHAIVHIDSMYYHVGIDLAAGDSLADGRDHFLSAIAYNPFHIPSHLALTKVDMRDGNKVAALKRLGRVYSVMNPIGHHRDGSDLLSDTLLTMFFEAARALIDESRYTQSLSLLQHVEDFCDEAGSLFPCPHQLHLLVSESHQGIYNSFLVVAGRALQNDDLDFAVTYIQSALEYRLVKQAYVDHPEEALELLFRVFTRNRVLADLFGVLGESGGAQRHLAAAKEIAHNHPMLFDHVSTTGNVDDLQAGVLNYAAAGMTRESISMLKLLKSLGVASSTVAYHQRVAGAKAAGHYRKSRAETKKPEALVNELTGGDPWFQIFAQSFIDNWRR